MKTYNVKIRNRKINKYLEQMSDREITQIFTTAIWELMNVEKPEINEMNEMRAKIEQMEARMSEFYELEKEQQKDSGIIIINRPILSSLDDDNVPF